MFSPFSCKAMTVLQVYQTDELRIIWSSYTFRRARRPRTEKLHFELDTKLLMFDV